MKRFPRRERKNAPTALIVCYDNSFLHFAIFFPSLADSKRAFPALPCRESIRQLTASASWESHPRALARTLSCKYHHSSRLSSPPSGAVPDGRILILRLAESSASTPEKRNSVLRWLCVDNPVDIPEAAAVLPLCFPYSLLFLLDVCIITNEPDTYCALQKSKFIFFRFFLFHDFLLEFHIDLYIRIKGITDILQ